MDPTHPTYDRVAAHRGSLGADWRWKTAQLSPSRTATQLLGELDEHVLRAHEYLSLTIFDGRPEARLAAQEQYPAIAAAEALQSDRLRREPLMILTLGGCPVDEIAGRTGLDAAVVEEWQRLFFDLAEVRESAGWLLSHVIPAGATRGPCRLRVPAEGGPRRRAGCRADASRVRRGRAARCRKSPAGP